MSQRHLLLLAGMASLLVFSCTDTDPDHPVFNYFPEASVFEEGYVNKYYEHYYPTSTSATARTRISYGLFRKTGETEYVIENYNAGFWLTGKRFYRVEGAEIQMDSSVNIWRTDTTTLEVAKGLVLKWDKDKMAEAHYVINGDYDTYSFTYSSQQVASKDSLIDGLPAKVFVEQNKRVVMSEDTTVYEWNTTSYYLEGLGYYGLKEVLDDYTWEVELVEQMPLSEFKKLRSHKEKRVAYIDPLKTLDRGRDFKLCGHEKFIADYYNSTPDGDYKYGKAALIDTIFSNLDEEKLMNQTGMLTFRFVVNCEGEAGRFIAKGYDLNYQPYEFPEETINHLYDLMQKLKEWRVVVLNEEPSDAYFYFTFRLNNGKITDILP